MAPSLSREAAPGAAALAAAAAVGTAAGLLLASAALRHRRLTWLLGAGASATGGAVKAAAPDPSFERLSASSAAHRQWMQQMRSFIFDIDGVIHVAGTPVPGAADAIAALREAGKQVIFMTNNAGKTPQDLVALFAKMGVMAVEAEVVTSAMAAASYLASCGLQGKAVYVVGLDSLARVLRERAEVVPFGAEADAAKTREDCEREFKHAMDPPAESVSAVVVGVDYRFNYFKLTRAANYLRANRDCLFVATNPDPRASLGPAAIVPAAGSLVEAVACAAGRRPDIVCGKPSRSLAAHLLETRGMAPATTCMVGDRTDTDMEFGRCVGMQTLFVESGSMTEAEARADEPQRHPHFTAPSIAVLRDLLKPLAR